MAFTVNRYRQNVRSAFRDMSEEAARQQREMESERRRGGWTRPANIKKKKITRDVGEYVKWEEVEVTEASSTEQNSTTDYTKYYSKEEQIIDVKWEDIK